MKITKSRSIRNRVALLVILFVVNSAAGVFTVTTTADTGNGTLRQAILQANSHAGPDTIGFDIPETGMIFNGLCWFIEPFSNLPALTDSGTVIDGATQAARRGDTNPNGPEIYLFGYQGRNGSHVSTGLLIQSSGNVVRNLIVSCFNESGIVLSGPKARFNRIEGNFIGTNFSGQDTIESPNQMGVVISDGARHNTIGGATAGQGNVISGNRIIGVNIQSADSNRVIGNHIGTDLFGSRSLGNGEAGLVINNAAENDIGGMADGEGNLISGNGYHGVYIAGGLSTGNRIAGNWIGTNKAGTQPLPNGSSGVYMYYGASRNRIGPANRIHGNDGYGITLYFPETVQNTITRNSISGNSASGILIAQGANAGIASPVIQRTTEGVAGTASPNATVEIFSDPSMQGAVYEGTATADASGNFVWTGTPVGPMITATATDETGNTSQFSSAVSVTGIDKRQAGLPGACFLSDGYPNPFNASTVFRFGVPSSGRVKIEAIDARGRTIGILVDGHRPAGEYTVRFDASGLASGIYFIRMEAEGFTASRKMAVVK